MDSYDPTVIFFFLLVLRECKEISVVIGDENPLSTFDDSSEKNLRGHLFQFSGPRSARSQHRLTTNLQAVVQRFSLQLYRTRVFTGIFFFIYILFLFVRKEGQLSFL